MRKLLSVCLCALAAAASSPAVASVQFNFNADKDGNPALGVSVLVQQFGDELKFEISMTEPLVNIGDLQGIFFHVSDTGLLSGLTSAGTDVTGSQYGADSVNSLGGGVNTSGLGTFDVGVKFGTSGIGSDDIQSTTFFLSHSTLALSLDTFFASGASVANGYVMAIRATSVGAPDGPREGSVKVPTGDPTPGPDPEPTSTPEPMSLAIWGALAIVSTAIAKVRSKK